jgi:phosphoglycerate dehydrogenase-like enzyme
MTRHVVAAFNCVEHRDYLGTLTAGLPVDIQHVAFHLPWEEIAARRAGRAGNHPAPPELQRVLATTEIIFGFALPQRLTELAPRLRWVETPAVGYDQLHGTSVLESDIPVTTVGALFAGAVAEHTFALLLALIRRLDEFRAAQARREWTPLQVGELQDATIAIVGLGNIGRAVAALAKAFRMHVIGTRPRSGQVPPGVDEVFPREELAAMLSRADVVVVAVAGTAETTNLIGAPELAVMKSSAYLINVARGVVVDEPALAHALASGRLAGAGLDAFVHEPLPTDSPLWTLPNVIMTPHVAVNVASKLRRAVAHFGENLARFCRGEPLVDRVGSR